VPRRLDVDLLAGHGVGEAQPRCVQELAREAVGLAPAVLTVADHGVADGGHVDANLVRAAGFELGPQQAGGGERALEPKVGARLARHVGIDRNQQTIATVAPDGGIDRP
jgi:hypothetical protein